VRHHELVKRVLWVTAIAPRFDSGGGEIRQAHLIEALAGRFEVELLLAGRLRDQRVRSMLHAVKEVPASTAVDPPGGMRRRLRDVRWEILERRPDEVARHGRVRRALAPELAAWPEPDIVCVEYIGLAPLLPRRRRGFWALTLHNLPSEMARHSASIAPGRRQRIMQEVKARNARRVERWTIGEYDLVVAVSPEDAAALAAEDAAALGAEVAVVPNGVDTARLAPSELPTGLRVVFIGALHTFPNRDGIRWFATEAWPAIRSRVPGATLDVVGARPPDDVIELAQIDGVSVHPDVPDVAPFLARASVAVVPLRIGSGSRLKVLEAMAAARPVVGTSVGLGGLAFEPGADALVADDPESLAGAVTRVLGDRELASSLAAGGRRLVEARYSWTGIGADYAALLEARAAGSTSSPPISSETIATNSPPTRSQPKRSTT
jgi:glycosyltransferase involved in cell wall biosynthesis